MTNRFVRGVLEAIWPDRAEGRAIAVWDGAWTPNSNLEAGSSVLRVQDLQDVVPLTDGGMAVAAGNQVSIYTDGGSGLEISARHLLPAAVTCLDVADNLVLAACSGYGLCEIDLSAGTVRDIAERSSADYLGNITAVSATSGGYWLTIGSSTRDPSEWKRDVMLRGRTGKLVWLDSDGTALTEVLSGLAWPSGVVGEGRDSCVFSEAWANRVSRWKADSGVTHVLEDTPAYPGAISRDDHGYVVAFFAPRSALVEFLMDEPKFLDRMFQELEERAWVTPTLRTENHQVEQLQGGQLLVFGEVKPWAPTRSAGVVGRLSADGAVRWTAQSRAGGKRHGITRAFALGGHVWCVSAGAAELFTIEDRGRS